PSTLHPLIYTLSLHDALPILASSLLTTQLSEAAYHDLELPPAYRGGDHANNEAIPESVLSGMVSRQLSDRYAGVEEESSNRDFRDRKSTRLNYSHQIISYAVF